ncbi:trafficking protein particle complex subunit 5 [Nephila pilipes]|uniref:Trafficking protein particle complex subunit 5 n=2 Tax=Nephilidae TaxID=450948 RepID=A0A8X6R278_NEPPI|nr:trafficking protein particle complex subunit 5 [Nephila pilipes]
MSLKRGVNEKQNNLLQTNLASALKFGSNSLKISMSGIIRTLPKVSILDKPLSKGRSEINISAFALLFSEIVQYCQSRVLSVPELQAKLSEMGYHVGQRMVDTLFVRERNFKRETKLLNILIFIKTTLWKTLFGKEADKLEHANDDKKTYFIIEAEPLVNKFISIPKDKGSLNCAAFVAGIIEATLVCCNFPAKVTAHWHQGTTFKIIFDQSVVNRDHSTDGR